MYKVIRNNGSGNCLFYAIAQGVIHLLKYTDDYLVLGKKLRKIAVNEIRFKATSDESYRMILSVMYADYVLNGKSVSRDYTESYISWMSGNAWGGDIEIKAFERYLKLFEISGIRVYYANTMNNGRTQQNLVPINHLGTRIKKRKYPIIKIILHDANNGGTHYEFIHHIINISKSKTVSVK